MALMERSPSLIAKLKTKNAVSKMKHGSPKLQEVLRQRCRQRMKEKRGRLFDGRRPGLMMETDEEVHDVLTEIVRAELSQLVTLDIDGRNELLMSEEDKGLTEEEALALEAEILAEEEEWILLEYDRLQQEEAKMAMFAEDSLREIVICPLCERGSVTEAKDALICSLCDLKLPLKTTAREFGNVLQGRVAYHSTLCSGRPGFMVLPEAETVCLYLTCETCSDFALII